MSRGLFITLEGIDGTGTTTQARRLVKRLRRMKLPALLTWEPSRGPIGRLIDRLISEDEGKRTDRRRFHEAVALLFAADRLDHLATEILPALKEGRVVVSDRYVMSSWAYQSVVVDEGWVREINLRAPAADLTLLLDAPPELCLKRVTSRNAKRQIFEREKYLRSVRSIYRRLAREERAAESHVVVVNAANPIGKVEATIWHHVEALLINSKRLSSK